jgi:CheY-like chemotaxis protein
VKILTVDDDLTSRLILTATLERLGHEVVQTTNGEQALEQFRLQPTPVIIADWIMPGKIDGLELCRLVRSTPLPTYTSFILLTSANTRTGFLEAMKAGVDDFMVKPCHQEQLAARLQIAQRLSLLHNSVSTIAALLPICGTCGQRRSDEQYCEQLHSFLSNMITPIFKLSSTCPNCSQPASSPLKRPQPSPAETQTPPARF